MQTSSIATSASQPGLAISDRGVFSVHADASSLPALWWLGVHGGAGESALEALFAGSRAAGHAWPLLGAERRAAVVLVARTHARGLRAVQAAMGEHDRRELALDVLGLVLISDSPGRLPRTLRDLSVLVSGGVPRVWSLPFIEAWRVGETPNRRNSPREAGLLRDELQALLALRQEGQ